MNWREVVRGRPVIITAGGGIGEPVTHWRRTWPDALFVLFEPAPAYFAELRRKYGDDPLVFLDSEALSDKPGPATFYLSSTPMASSLLPFNISCPAYFPQWATAGTLTVQATTLDVWCKWHNVGHIGLVELDLQGGELAALRGAEGLLQAKAIDALVVEVFYTDLYQGAPLAGEVVDYMAGLGYRAMEERNQEGSQFADITFIGGNND